MSAFLITPYHSELLKTQTVLWEGRLSAFSFIRLQISLLTVVPSQKKGFALSKAWGCLLNVQQKQRSNKGHAVSKWTYVLSCVPASTCLCTPIGAVCVHAIYIFIPLLYRVYGSYYREKLTEYLQKKSKTKQCFSVWFGLGLCFFVVVNCLKTGSWRVAQTCLELTVVLMP